MRKTIVTGVLIAMICCVNRIPVQAEALLLPLPGFQIFQAVYEKELEKVQDLENKLWEKEERETVSRAEYAALLADLFDWKAEFPAKQSYIDVSQATSYYGAIEAAVKYGATPKTGFYRPTEAITRQEAIVMLIQALGYQALAESGKEGQNPFSDVSEDSGYSTLAARFSLLESSSEKLFRPKDALTWAEALELTNRTREKFTSKIEYLHGFYAFSSWDQKKKAAQMDGVSMGWSRLEYNNITGIRLNTTAENGNDWKIPDGFEQAAVYFEENNVPIHLSVYMSAPEACAAILTSEENRKRAVEVICQEVNKVYKETGKSIYSGVTIDFEGMKGDLLRNGFCAFLEELQETLKGGGKNLFVAVHPVTSDGIYYDAYDYRKIGELADKVILMAHDYQANSMDEETRKTGFTTTPVTPFPEIYYALMAATDEKTGVKEKEKLVLAISISSAGWTVADGEVLHTYAETPSYGEIYQRVKEGAEVQYSAVYKNPFIVYQSEEGKTTVWYENGKSIEAKVQLAKMFGINGFSIWRIGLIPEDIWTAIDEQR